MILVDFIMTTVIDEMMVIIIISTHINMFYDLLSGI